MLAANTTTKAVFSKGQGANVHEYADFHSSESIRRYIQKNNPQFEQAGARIEYDGQIIRCIVIDKNRVNERFKHHKERLYTIDPLCYRIPSSELTSDLNRGVLWWHDLKHLSTRYKNIKAEVTELASFGKDRLEHVPVVVGGDWRFNAWACPAESYGNFIMVHFGFINAYAYAVMFYEMLSECKEASDKGQASGIVTSSMIWWAAIALGYESYRWDNLMLPTSEYDRLGDMVMNPPDHIQHTINIMDAFAMLHECGHIVCGHTDRLREWLLDKHPSESERQKRLQEMQDMEHEADRFACQSICSHGNPGQQCLDAILILFSMLRLCEDHRNPNTTLTSTHPCATDRFCLCHNELFSGSGDVLFKKMINFIIETSKRRLEWQQSLKNDTESNTQSHKQHGR